MKKRPTVLMILDGYGLNEKKEGNAIAQAKTPVMDELMSTCPFVKGNASGLAVGLPDGQMGNSEVGHLNMGAGRIVYQDLTRITKEIEDGTFFDNKELKRAMENAKEKDSSLHMYGLLSDGGVHSHITHLYALLEMAKRYGLTKVYVHCFLDGRDTPPASGKDYVQALTDKMQEIGVGEIATVMGRYYAMDRDNRWDRVEKAYRAMTQGEGVTAASGVEAVAQSYEKGETDEFVLPTVVMKDWDRVEKAYRAMTQGEGVTAASGVEAVAQSYEKGETDEFVLPTVVMKDGAPTATIQDNDSVIFFNFRPDRAREISRTFCCDDFDGFDRGARRNVVYVCFTEYDVTIPNKTIAFPKVSVTNTFGEYLAAHGMKQARIAETEKYAHVTFFFNGGVEAPNEGEDRILVNSPKVATYDLQPEMSVYSVCDKVVEAVTSGKYDVVITNFANPDMVGHTGVMDAAVKAIEAVDECVGKVVAAVKEVNAQMFICADHGNAEQLVDYDTQAPFTAHTTNAVPFILVNCDEKYTLKEGGRLADIVPTLIELMGMEQPAEMTGESLLIEK